MRTFLLVWIGQVVSVFGSAMTRFALTVWAYELTGTATALALVAFFSFVPEVLLSPLAGALVDRWNRKLVMMLSDLAAGLSTVAIFLLHSAGQLEIWHLYVAGAFAGVFATFQWPAFSAAVTTILPKRHYARAQGMMGVAESASGLVSPALAVLVLAAGGLRAVLLIDIATFVVAVTAILVVTIPQPPRSAAGEEGRGTLLHESLYGFRYILKRPSLLGLQLMFFQVNLFGSLTGTLLAPMILARTNSSSESLAIVQTALALGGLAGGLWISVRGGPTQRVYGVLLGMMGGYVCNDLLMGLGRGLPVWAVGAFLGMIAASVLNASNQAIWQAKVPPDVQGRVFSVRRMIAQISAPVGMLLAGPLADVVFEPAMQPGGALAGLFGGLVGVGPGAGMALLIVLAGLLGLLVTSLGFFIPAIREAETRVPDHDAVAIQQGQPA